MICSQGDIIEVGFDPTLGHEPNKRRPALVVSADAFNMRSSLTVVCPITSRMNGYPLHVEIEDPQAPAHGAICVEQMRSLDLEARWCEKLGVLDEKTMDEVLNIIGAVFGI